VIALERLTSRLALMCPNAAPAQLQLALVEAAKDFMAQTQVFTDRAALPLQSGVTEYCIDLRHDQALVSVHSVEINGCEITDWRRDGHEDVVIVPAGYAPREAGHPYSRTLHDPHARHCMPQAWVHYAWKIKTPAAELPEKLVDDYWMALSAKALSILHRMFGSLIVSAGRAQDCDEQYSNEVANIRARAAADFSCSADTMWNRNTRRRHLRR
jgi:hypothetical protein